jgi:hypothetical protein
VLLVHGDDDQIVLYVDSAPGRSAVAESARGISPRALTDPDVILSHHPARATARRLPPSIDCRVPPVAG